MALANMTRTRFRTVGVEIKSSWGKDPGLISFPSGWFGCIAGAVWPDRTVCSKERSVLVMPTEHLAGCT
jgi:hypothetical protein